METLNIGGSIWDPWKECSGNEFGEKMKNPYENREGGGTCLWVEKKVKFAFNNVGKIFSLSEPGHIYIVERFGGIKDSCGRNPELRNAEVANSTSERFDRF